MTSASASRNLATSEESNGPSIAKIDGLARFVLQLLHKFWIQLGTGGNEWLQFLRYVRIATGDHASRGVCGLSGGLVLLSDQHIQALSL